MMAEILMSGVIGLTVGACFGYSIKHIQDTKYLKEYEKYAEHSCKEIADKGKAALVYAGKVYHEELQKAYDENLALKKEINNLRHPDFFVVPNKIKTDSKLIFEDRK